MTSERTQRHAEALVRELCRLPRETEWVEFKTNNSDPEQIGEYLSALANSAALSGKASAYLVWGVQDLDHSIVGTSFDPFAARVGGEELQNWLLRLLEPKLEFRFVALELGGHRVVLLEIERAARHPVRFSGQEYLRVGSYKKKLKDFPEKERALWRLFDRTPFEDGVAAGPVTDVEVLHLLDYPAYFDLLDRPLPADRRRILDALADERLIRKTDAGCWDVTNLGAVLFARRLADFRGVSRKAARVIMYRGAGRTETLREELIGEGYASGFRRLVEHVDGLLPANEVIQAALRRNLPMFPPLAVRELIANALIHQDFLVTGAGPMVEIFADRIEVTNPGEPLVDVQRFVDAPPKSRNEVLASLMRRLGICEERGSGIDKVVSQVEFFQLPAPLFETSVESTRAVLFAHKPLSAMDKPDRVRACYLHACLRYVMRQPMTNASLRQRLGIEDKNIATVSRLLAEAVEAGLIVVADPRVGTRSRSYLPFWGAPRTDEGGIA
jgi:predicted HTH transcriptional regulator